LLQVVETCYKLLRLVTSCWDLLQVVETCYKLLRLVTSCWDLLTTLLRLVDNFVETFYKLLRLVTSCWDLLQVVETCYKLLRLVTSCWDLLQVVETCYKLFQQLVIVLQFNNLSTGCEWQPCSNLINNSIVTTCWQACHKPVANTSCWQDVRFLCVDVVLKYRKIFLFLNRKACMAVRANSSR
jgi:hypothetical protein